MANYKHRWLIIMSLVFSAGLQQARASTIVDTGPANGTQYDFGGSGNQWLAAEFTISENYTLSAVDGWMLGVLGETGTIAIYTDGGDLPGSEIFSLSFTGSSDAASWQGISGLSWNILAGTYWVSFERRSGQTVNGTLPGGSPSPLGNEAYRNTFTANNWVSGDANNFGVRINALDPSPVPLPSAFWLFGSGLIGLFEIARFKKASGSCRGLVDTLRSDQEGRVVDFVLNRVFQLLCPLDSLDRLTSSQQGAKMGSPFSRPVSIGK